MYSPFPLLVETERQIALLRANRIRLLHCLFRLIFRKTFLLCQFFETFSIDVVLVHVCPNGGRVGRRSTTPLLFKLKLLIKFPIIFCCAPVMLIFSFVVLAVRPLVPGVVAPRPPRPPLPPLPPVPVPVPSLWRRCLIFSSFSLCSFVFSLLISFCPR